MAKNKEKNPQKRHRKPLTDIQKQAHAMAQAAYKLRQKTQAAKTDKEREKNFNALLRLNIDRSKFARQNGIKHRTNSAVKAAKEAAGVDRVGIHTTFSFQDAKDARAQMLDYYHNSNVQSFNGVQMSPLQALSALDNIILAMASNGSDFPELEMIFDNETGELFGFIDNDSEAGEE